VKKNRGNRVSSCTLSLLLALAMTSFACGQCDPQHTMLVDVVELIDAGKETQGKPEFTAVFNRYEYRFANAANLDVFQKEPSKYEIQLGGACARMGPLSGAGSTGFYGVHDKKLYIFASEQCRASFLNAPEKLLETDDPSPEATELEAQATQRGRRLVERAVTGIGGGARLDAIRTYRERIERQQESAGAMHRVSQTLTVAPLSVVRMDDCWDDSCWGNAATRVRGWSISPDGAEDVHEQQRAALWRRASRNVVMLLRARHEADFVVSSAGENRLISVPGEGEIDISLFTVHWRKSRSMLGVDGAGRIRLLEHRGRGPNLAMGRIEKIYGGFRDVAGLNVPSRVSVMFDGKPFVEQSTDELIIEIDEPSHAALLER
jgi:YHS domain-containing protein